MGGHEGYILASYLCAAFVIAAIGVWIITDRKQLSRELEALEAERDTGHE